MRTLVVAATAGEMAPIVDQLKAHVPVGPRIVGGSLFGHDVHLLTTGVGMVATAAWCSRVLTAHRYDVALNVGVCGSFGATLALGSVVHVVSDRIAELGAEDGERFLSIEELGLLEEGGMGAIAWCPVSSDAAAFSQNSALLALPRVTGITVNTVHGHERSIAAVVERFHPQVESMEGAAFMSACLVCGVPCAQVRAVSNIVERRNRDAWRLPEAIANLGDTAAKIIEAL